MTTTRGAQKQALLLTASAFLLAFFAVPLLQLDFLTRMPGDLGDARLNNYFLENIYLFIRGHASSLIDLPFLYPYPLVGGFSDNLFGSSPGYLIPRWLGFESDTSFQIWYLFGYLANYTAAYYALRRLGCGVAGSIVGALIFSFALPTTAKFGHAQLHYRFGVPLAMMAFGFFLTRGDWQQLSWAALWLVWQFYCTIYIGFFLGLLLAVMLVIALVQGRVVRICAASWSALARSRKAILLLNLLVLALMLVLLFLPYLQVSSLYQAKRDLSEIRTMLPRLNSYLIADTSWIWGKASSLVGRPPMRPEHQLFIGLAPLTLATLGWAWTRRDGSDAVRPLFVGALLVLLLATLYVSGFTLWQLVAGLPLFSAIRAVTRIELALLFPLAYLAARAVDRLARQSRGRALLYALLPFMVFEFAATTAYTSSKTEWRDRISAQQRRTPAELPADAILFYAQTNPPFFADEIDAMWVAQQRGLKTINGYTGFAPKGYELMFGTHCREAPKRLLAYLAFTGQREESAYLGLMRRVIPLGFEDCNPAWWQQMPQLTIAPASYPAEVFKKVAISAVESTTIEGRRVVTATVNNDNDMALAASSAVATPIRLSWRFADAEGKSSTGWDPRTDLPFDVPAHGKQQVLLPVDLDQMPRGGSLQVSFVQEGVFWAHDLGVPPASAPAAALGLSSAAP